MNWASDQQGKRGPLLLFWLAAVFTFVMAALPHPPELPGHLSDKIQHVTAFATLAMLGSWAFPRLRRFSLAVRLSLFGAFIEIVQAIPALHRDSDVTDWIADTLACILMLLAIRYWPAAKRPA